MYVERGIGWRAYHFRTGHLFLGKGRVGLRVGGLSMTLIPLEWRVQRFHLSETVETQIGPVAWVTHTGQQRVP